MRDPLDDADLDRMLDGGPLPPALAALRAPAQPAELRGEEAAVAAFRAARQVESAPPRRARLVGRALVGRALAVKVAVAGAVLAGGGLAVAAAMGTLPVPGPDKPPASDPHGPTRPGGVVNEQPTQAPQPPPGGTPTATPQPTGPAGAGNGNGWGRNHGTGQPSKPAKATKSPNANQPTKAPNANKATKAPNPNKPTQPPGQSR
ncbi:hypothetical protein [Asanoa iriomotensis]|uniref:Uncharacterized protein n=1 Tax=Asanoa iriomotensis TaxID=234613 RepID=A0ABQ4CDW4_9ACTN|nr:hypothetical protein [Asanoa iriomotensis]GIF60958.1 hypothetical protein Air01nite_70530 [Asanoa iriomotensis]